MNHWLIHTVSDQPIPNLLVWAALRPSRVLQIRSAKADFEGKSEDLRQAAMSGGFPADPVEELVLPQAFPTAQDVLEALRRRLEGEPGPWVVNLTGGTKLMSLGALRAADEHAWPAVYADTRDAEPIQSVGRVGLPLPAKAEYWPLLGLRSLLLAHGREVNADEVRPAMAAFAKASREVREQAANEVSDWMWAARRAIGHDGEHFPKKKSEGLERVLGTTLPRVGPALAAWRDAAVAAGLLWVDRFGDVRLAPDGVNQPVTKSMGTPAESNWRMLEGSWWELCVWQALRDRGYAAEDLLWSVRDQHGEGVSGELDLLALDRRDLTLRVISCKTSTEFLKIDHLRGVAETAKKWCGAHAQGHLCVWDLPEGRRGEFERKAQDARIKLHWGPDLAGL